MTTVLHLLLLLAVPPLLPGVIARVKAIAAGRRGPPLLQPYLDLARLLRKGAVYGHGTTWVIKAGPLVSLAAALTAGLLLPLGARAAPLSFPGDVVAFAALLALARFFTVAAALDAGSSFEGMGASREASFGALGEPVLLLVLALLCVAAGGVGFAEVLEPVGDAGASAQHPVLLVAGVALFLLLLAENARIPVDDPNTHLELTMIHEVMVLDHGGPDLAFIQYGAALKLFLFAALLAHVALPFPAGALPGTALLLAAVLAVAAGVGVVESVMARLRLVRVPQLLVAAGALAALGVAVLLEGGR
ncbi:MAG TPA: NADH-quinone oxidoreductase subunit H [Anaeromyxobacter sp.]|nr:NADH-quinone oxidoreductase subunit H [Anaeromyxobacter sp.]